MQVSSHFIRSGRHATAIKPRLLIAIRALTGQRSPDSNVRTNCLMLGQKAVGIQKNERGSTAQERGEEYAQTNIWDQSTVLLVSVFFQFALNRFPVDPQDFSGSSFIAVIGF